MIGGVGTGDLAVRAGVNIQTVRFYARHFAETRVCELGRNIAVRETIGESFAYTGEGAPLMKRALNRWSVEAHGAQTLVTMAGLKYLVENGHAYAENPRRLLPIPSIC